MTGDHTVVVVGAGMSGLVAARDLTRAGVDAVVFEAAKRPGGRVLAETSVLGSRLDLGGQWIGFGHERFAALAAEYGLTAFPMRTPDQPAIVDGGAALARCGTASAIAYATIAAWDHRARRGVPASWSSTTVARWLRRVPGARARRALEVAFGVMTTADPDRMTMAALASVIVHQGGIEPIMASRGGAQESLLVEGAGTLAEKIAAELGDRVRCGEAVTEIRQSATGVEIETAGGRVRAERVLVTVPAPVQSRITFDPPLPPERVALTGGTYMGSVYKAIAVYPEPFWREGGHAEMLALDPPGRAVFDTTAPGGPGHLCFLLAGPEARSLDGVDEAERRRRLLEPLAAHLGEAVLEPAGWHDKSWHLDEFAGGGYTTVPEPGTTAGYYPHSTRPCGVVHWAGSETAAAHAGYIDGAVASGHRAATEIAAALDARPENVA